MARVFFQKASSGYRVIRGDVVRSLQLKFQTAGHNPGIIDGIFGNDTENAVKSFQLTKGQPPTGKLTDEAWVALMQAPTPSIFARCLQLTADFEGYGPIFRESLSKFAIIVTNPLGSGKTQLIGRNSIIDKQCIGAMEGTRESST